MSILPNFVKFVYPTTLLLLEKMYVADNRQLTDSKAFFEVLSYDEKVNEEGL